MSSGDLSSSTCDYIDLNLEQTSSVLLIGDDVRKESSCVGEPQETNESLVFDEVDLIEDDDTPKNLWENPENLPEMASDSVPVNVLGSQPEMRSEEVLGMVPEILSDAFELVSERGPEMVLDAQEMVSDVNEMVSDVPEMVPDVHEMVSDAHEMVPDAHEMESDAHEMVPDAHEMVSDAHEMVPKIALEMVSEVTSEKVLDRLEEPEEGEISDDDNEGSGNGDTVLTLEKEKDELSDLKTETSEKPLMGKLLDQSNGDVVKSGWNWPKEAPSFSGKPNKFYQFAWAKGVQGSTKESKVDPPPSEASSSKIGDVDPSPVPLPKSSSWSENKDAELVTESKSGWIVGDRGMEYVNFLRSDDGFIYLQEGGERSDVRWRRSRGDKGFSERLNMSKHGNDNKAEEKFRNALEGRGSMPERGYRRRFDFNRYSKDHRRRDIRGGRRERSLDMEERDGKLGDIGPIGSNKQMRYSRGRELSPLEMPFAQPDLKGRRDSDAFDHFRIMSDSLKDKLFAECNELLRNVSVKDAQKSFMGVCKQLRRAVKILRDLNKRIVQFKHSEGYERKIVALTRDVIAGIRAAYAVHNTPIGRLQTEGTEAFPRLLDLARNRCHNLFTSDQIEELDSIISSLGCLNKADYMPNSYRQGLEFEKGEDKEWRFGESSCNTSATTQLESDSSTDTSNGRAREAKLRPNTDAEKHLSGVLPTNTNILNDHHPIMENNNVAGSLGLGSWAPSIPQEHNVVQNYVFPREIPTNLIPIPNHAMNYLEPTSFASVTPIVNQIPTNLASIVNPIPANLTPIISQIPTNLTPIVNNQIPTNLTPIVKNQIPTNLAPIVNQIPTTLTPLGNNAMAIQDGYPKSVLAGNGEIRMTNTPMREPQGSTLKNRRFVPNIDPVKALTSYHEKFAGKSHSGYTRLPSPTPSDEDEGATANSELEAARVNTYTSEMQATIWKGEGSQSVQQSFPALDAFQPEPRFVVKDSSNISNGNRLSFTELKLFSSSVLPVAGVEDMDPEGHLSKSMLARKNRDPRRRLANQASEGDLPQPSMSNEGQKEVSNEILHLKKHDSLIANQTNPSPKGELVSLLTLGTGGEWSSEQGLMPSIPEILTVVPETSARMDIDDEALHTHVDSSNELPQPKRQFELSHQESPSKRQKPIEETKEGDNLAVVQNIAISGDMKQSLRNDKTSVHSRSQQKLAKISSESSTDLSKPKMKPRDPRRVLLGSTLERAKNQEVLQTVKGSMTTPSVIAVNTMAQSKAEVAAPDSFLVERKLVSSTSKDDASQPVGNDPSQDIDSNPNNSRGEDDSSIGKSGGISSKVPVNKVANDSDFNGSVSLTEAPKPSESISHWSNLEPLLEGLDEKRKQAVRQERARRIEEQTRMFVAKKLCLVLDLDHTLLNSAKFAEIEEEWESKLRANEVTERAKFGKDGNKRELYRFPHMSMWTKLRPGIWNFLARASQLYELHVYTMGNKAYATEMAKLLDPTGVLFAGRVISKGDDGDVSDGDERPPKSKDLDGVLGMESAVVIIDDSARVWPHHRHNLIVVERYMYFPCSRKQFGLPGPSLLEVGHDEREPDGMLASALTVIEKIHYEFFSKPRLHQVDVRDILAKEQRKVLSGCKLVFSRVFPQGEIQPHLHPLWQLAEQFGAICSMAIDESVTHVVAISLGTDKVNWALSTGRFVVRPSWLEASVILYRRANEQDFSVVP